MKEINVLHIVKSLSGYGGTAVKIYEHVTNDNSTINHMFLCTEEIGWIGEKLQHKGFKVFKLSRLKYDFRLIKDIIQIIKKEKVGIIHSYFPRENFYGRIAAIFSKTKSITSIEGIERNENRILKCFNFLLNLTTYKIITISESVYKSIYGYNSKKVIVYNGISDPKKNIDNIDRNFFCQNERLNNILICFVGGFIEIRRHSILIKAFENLSKKYSNIKLILIGDGPEKENIKNLIEELGIEKNVVLLGYQKFAYNFISMCDIYCNPTVNEGFGIATVEAMMLEKPIIVANSGASKELIVHMKSGLIFNVDDIEHLSEQLITFIENPELRKKLGRSARTDALEKYSINTYSENMRLIYHSALERKN